MNAPIHDRSHPSASIVRAEGKAGYPAASAPADATVRFRIEGLTCAAEGTRLEHRLTGQPGILRATVNPINEIAYITFDPSLTSPEGIRNAIEAEGFGASGHH